ncbi:hypothetical protein [Flavobacterium sp. YO12]|uniref:hypothetical protein n=1 Tax=Flavobacterium sp. YO12 TaxID=1920029 RepID=UPI00100B65A3|nr:hypothetical protein [Flavobacterium sp. YO12]RXM43912.1 hypothetical protein BOW55_18375 [Flavobacterium sp. YO12]
MLIIGDKQKTYTAIKQDLIDKFSYKKSGKPEPEDFIEFNISDTKTLLRDIISLDFKDIHAIYNFIKEEIQSVVIELEVSRTNGSYPTSLLTHREISPETRAINAQKILREEEFSELTLEKINGYFSQLAAITRVTREIYFFIIDEGEYNSDTFCIYQDEAIRKLNINPKKLREELTILERKNLIYSVDEEDPKIILKIIEPDIAFMLSYIKENLDLHKIIVNLDFTKLDIYAPKNQL